MISSIFVEAFSFFFFNFSITIDERLSKNFYSTMTHFVLERISDKMTCENKAMELDELLKELLKTCESW